ncbi:MAG: TetR/AcrR family transcriptional regulator [Pseudomonadales bacterium]|nr:TetR/AcrR family transcriptional regulator [Pseudomonadales bacterium]
MSESKMGRKPKYSRDTIVMEAVAHADEFGLDQVTMAKVAKRVGCTPMALYSHVENHDALLCAMADQALSELDGDFSRVSDWREGVRLWLQTLWQASLKRPWLVEVIMVNERVTLQWLKFNEELLALLESAGMNDQQIAESLAMVGCIAVGAIFQATKFPFPRSGVVESGLSQSDLGQLDANKWAALVPYLHQQTNDSFLTSIEDLLILSFEAKLKR